MVRKVLLYLFGITFFPFLVFAADFVASVDRTRVGVGDSFVLTLKLSGASPKSSPDLSSLQKAFDIRSQQQATEMTIINGQMSSTTSWRYSLVPTKEGKQTLSAISLESSEGTLTSSPIHLSVGKASIPSPATQNKEIAFSVKVNKHDPYKNEPVVYTAKLISPHDFTNVTLEKIIVKNAIVEKSGEPEVYESEQNGMAVKILKIKFIITPLKSGPLKIPPLIIKGGILMRDKVHFDPFDMMRHFGRMNLFGVTQMEPFTVASAAIPLEVKAPVKGVTPWIAASSLKISENWNEAQIAKVGEPLTRSFTIVAEGAPASQLPNLKEQQGADHEFKIYADNPTVESHVKNDTVTSWSQENYTIIPQRSGKVILPEISVAWWDVKQNKIAYAKVPERVLNVAPRVRSNDAPPSVAQTGLSKINDVPRETPPPSVPAFKKENTVLYVIIASLVAIVLFFVFWMLNLQRRMTRLAARSNLNEELCESVQQEVKPSDMSYRALNEVKSVDELQLFLQRYGHHHWGTAKNASLETLFAAAQKLYPSLVEKDINDVVASLQDALYGGKEVDLEELKERVIAILQATKTKGKRTKDKTEKLPELNPK